MHGTKAKIALFFFAAWKRIFFLQLFLPLRDTYRVKGGKTVIDPNITAFFNETYDSTHRALLVYLTGKCKNLSDVNDICQDVYFEFYKMLFRKGVDYIHNPEGILRKLAKRKIYRFYKKQEKIPEVSLISDESQEEYLSETEMKNDRECMFTSEEEILIEEIHLFLKKKPDDIQKIFYLYFELEQTIPQIGKILSMKESTVKSKLYRTRDELRMIYQKEDADET